MAPSWKLPFALLSKLCCSVGKFLRSYHGYPCVEAIAGSAWANKISCSDAAVHHLSIYPREERPFRESSKIFSCMLPPMVDSPRENWYGASSTPSRRACQFLAPTLRGSQRRTAEFKFENSAFPGVLRPRSCPLKASAARVLPFIGFLPPNNSRTAEIRPSSLRRSSDGAAEGRPEWL